MSDLKGKTILVTGASKGIGAAIAAKLGAADAHVAAHYGSDKEGAEAAVSGIDPSHVRLLQCDLGDPRTADDLWREAVAWNGRIDVLVNNAAVMRLSGGVESDIDEWDRVWSEAVDVNLLAAARLLRHAVRHFLENGGGNLITISSWVAHRGVSNPEGIAYAATKAAITAATKTIARGYAKQNILAYIVAPGVVRTRLSEESAATLGGEEAVTAGLAMGEWVPPAELADLVTYLASGTCRHLTGATLDVNGASYLR